MTKRSPRQWPPTRFVAPPPLQNVSKPGDRGTTDPFYQFKKWARDDGKPFKSPEPKAEQGLLTLLASKTALIVMGCVLVAVFVALLVVMVAKA
jgi:hypothetical protein